MPNPDAILAYIAAQPDGTTDNEIAKALNIPRAAVRRQRHQLADAGLLVRIGWRTWGLPPDPGDCPHCGCPDVDLLPNTQSAFSFDNNQESERHTIRNHAGRCIACGRTFHATTITKTDHRHLLPFSTR